MVDHVGIIVLLLVLLAAPVWALFFQRRRTAGPAETEVEPDEVETFPEPFGVTKRLLAGVLVYLLVQTLVLLLVLWALAFHAVGFIFGFRSLGSDAGGFDLRVASGGPEVVMRTGTAGRWIMGAGPLWALAALLLAFAVVPWTGSFVFGGADFEMLPARLDWGVLFALAMLSFSSLVRALAEISNPDPAVAVTGVRRVSRLFASGAVLWLSILPMVLIFKTLRLSEMAQQQDALWMWSMGGTDWGLPAWGILFNPFAAALFLLAAMIHAGLAPFDVMGTEEELAGGRITDTPVPGSMTWTLADRLRSLLIAAIASVIFLGGGDFPEFPSRR